MISFKDHGKLITQFTKEELIQKLGVSEKSVFEYHEQKPVTYGVIAAERVLDVGYQSGEWRKADYVLLGCLDTYRNPVPSSRFSKFQGVFAFYRKHSDFIVENIHQKEKRVPLAPIALLWDGMLNNKAGQIEMASFIPYQVYEIDLVDNKDVYGGIEPPADSSQLVRDGLEVFKNHCISCHMMRGKGGGKGRDLSEIGNRSSDNVLRSQILNPADTMPSLRAVNPEPDAAADAVIAYLKAMAGAR